MVGHFPHVADDGTLITFDRDTALVHEDTQFITWDHPMVTGAIDMVTSGEFGNSGLSVIKHERLPTGTSLLELLYRIDCPSPAHLPVKRYISEPVVRLLLDSEGRNLASKLPHKDLTNIAMQIDKAVASQAIKAQADQIKDLLDGSKKIATLRLQDVQAQAKSSLASKMNEEIQRLTILKQNNPNIRDEDIQELQNHLQEMTQLLDKASIKLDAVRLVVVSD
jgi:ATP-dependent helicase HepA